MRTPSVKSACKILSRDFLRNLCSRIGAHLRKPTEIESIKEFNATNIVFQRFQFIQRATEKRQIANNKCRWNISAIEQNINESDNGHTPTVHTITTTDIQREGFLRNNYLGFQFRQSVNFHKVESIKHLILTFDNKSKAVLRNKENNIYTMIYCNIKVDRLFKK